MTKSVISNARQKFHADLISDLLVFTTRESKKSKDLGAHFRVASNADADNTASCFIANNIADQLGARLGSTIAGQTAGNKFEKYVAGFVQDTFLKLDDLRPGNWSVSVSSTRNGGEISDFEQFEHIRILKTKAENDPILQASLGNDYTISPDILVSRGRYADERINASCEIVDLATGRATSLRSVNGISQILHASISCKWTMRSDRAQNARSEALNLIRNRKGRVPHIIAVVAEPTPSRLSSLALGTGDLDCVYHFALYELQEAVQALGQSEAIELLHIMIDGKRLKDISDLPLDLCV
jgi:NgoMIV restriction enzyme